MMNLKKFYSALVAKGLSDKTPAEMSQAEIVQLIDAAAGTVHYWAEMLEWHRSQCREYCQRDIQCSTAASYYHMVRRAYEDATGRQDTSRFLAAKRLLQERTLETTFGRDSEADRTMPVEPGA